MLLPKYESRRIMAEALDKDEVDAIGYTDNPLKRLSDFIKALDKELKERNMERDRKIRLKDTYSISSLKSMGPFSGNAKIFIVCDGKEFPIKWEVDANNKSLIFTIKNDLTNSEIKYRVGTAKDNKTKQVMVKSTYNQIKNMADIIQAHFDKNI